MSWEQEIRAREEENRVAFAATAELRVFRVVRVSVVKSSQDDGRCCRSLERDLRRWRSPHCGSVAPVWRLADHWLRSM